MPHPVSRTAPAMERFMAKVEQTATCWIWHGAKTRHYGTFNDGGKTHRAHRWGYEQMVGPISAEADLDHVCRITLCVNPLHLEPVTHAENVLRGISPSGVNARKTHCKNNHAFTAENTKMRGKWRTCRQCKRDEQKRRKARRRTERTGAAA